jgi:hypothetical protein
MRDKQKSNISWTRICFFFLSKCEYFIILLLYVFLKAVIRWSKYVFYYFICFAHRNRYSKLRIFCSGFCLIRKSRLPDFRSWSFATNKIFPTRNRRLQSNTNWPKKFRLSQKLCYLLEAVASFKLQATQLSTFS